MTIQTRDETNSKSPKTQWRKIPRLVLPITRVNAGVVKHMILKQGVNCGNKPITHSSKNLLVKVLVDQKVTSGRRKKVSVLDTLSDEIWL